MELASGTFKNGVVELNEPVSWQEGQKVTIAPTEDNANTTSVPTPKAEGKLSFDEFMDFIDECAVDTGIEDLAHQHDHYLYGTPKTDRYPE